MRMGVGGGAVADAATPGLMAAATAAAVANAAAAARSGASPMEATLTLASQHWYVAAEPGRYPVRHALRLVVYVQVFLFSFLKPKMQEMYTPCSSNRLELVLLLLLDLLLLLNLLVVR